MSESILIIASLLILITCIIIYQELMLSKKVRLWIKDHYGKKPVDKEYDFKRISCYWNEIRNSLPEDELIDEITWNDLDMDRIFARINSCNSFVGEHVLYETLHRLPKDKYYTKIFEQKLAFFSDNAKYREDIQLILNKLGKEYGSYFLPMFLNHLDAFQISNMWVYRILQISLVLPIIPSLIFRAPELLILSAGIFCVNLLLYVINKNRYEINLNSLNSIIHLVKVGKKIVNCNQKAYENEFHDLSKEVSAFQHLSSMIGKLQAKKQASLSGDIFAMIYDYMLGATLWDFTKYHRIMRIIEGKLDIFMDLYRKIGELDMIISITSFRESLPFYCLPNFTNNKELQINDIYHPLIDEPVCNSVKLDKNCIITGSNASGKSTFIKAVTINALLAQNIHTCMAKRFELPFARIITSMAVRDSIVSGESYYIKEIKYLNRIIQSLSSNRLIICAIDEILKGTNTNERIAASVAILKYLAKQNCFAIVASHDIELTTQLEDLYNNYHFKEQIQANDIQFEYKIHNGPTTSKNAIRLLEYVNFPSEIIKDAKASL